MAKLIPAYIIIVLDQFSKLKMKSLYENENFFYDSLLCGILKFRFYENPGLAFGISVGSLGWLLFVITVLITFYILYYLLKSDTLDIYESCALSLILGGAVGNLIDRGLTLFDIFDYNGVIDFIDIGIFTHSFRWPYIFNIADLSVSVGIAIFIFCSFLNSNSDELNNEEA